MQRLITLDSVIYVHQNPRRSRLPAPEPELAVEPEGQANYSEPSDDWSPEPLQVPADVTDELERQAAEHERQAAEHEREVAEQEREVAEHELQAAEHERQAAEHERQAAELEMAAEPEPEPEPVARFTEHRKTVARSNPIAPPPGYAIEFGTGRLVPIHSFKGRMSYPTGR